MVVDALTELNGGSQTQILVDGRVSGHFKHRGAVVGALLRLNEELLGLLAKCRVGAKRCSQRLLQIVQEISVHSHFYSSADGVLTFSAFLRNINNEQVRGDMTRQIKRLIDSINLISF